MFNVPLPSNHFHCISFTNFTHIFTTHYTLQTARTSDFEWIGGKIPKKRNSVRLLVIRIRSRNNNTRQTNIHEKHWDHGKLWYCCGKNALFCVFVFFFVFHFSIQQSMMIARVMIINWGIMGGMLIIISMYIKELIKCSIN